MDSSQMFAGSALLRNLFQGSFLFELRLFASLLENIIGSQFGSTELQFKFHAQIDQLALSLDVFMEAKFEASIFEASQSDHESEGVFDVDFFLLVIGPEHIGEEVADSSELWLGFEDIAENDEDGSLSQVDLLKGLFEVTLESGYLGFKHVEHLMVVQSSKD